MTTSTEHTCTCEVEDIGDAENGPRLSITPDEACPMHGRDADPEGWAEADAWERGYLLSSIHGQLLGRGWKFGPAPLSDDALIARYEAIYEARYAGQEDYDGHNVDRAAAEVVDDLISEHGSRLVPREEA